MKIKRFWTALKRRPYLYGALPVVILLLGWFLFGRAGGANEELLTVARGDFVDEVSVSGTVTAAQDVSLGFAQSGRVSGVSARVGQTVFAGTVLASVENGDLHAAVAQKQAALEKAQADLQALQAGTRPEEIAIKEAEVAAKEDVLAQAIQDAYTSAEAAVHNSVDPLFSNPHTSPYLNFSVDNSQTKIDFENARSGIESKILPWQTAAQASQGLAAVSSLLSLANIALNHAIASSQNSADLTAWTADIAAARSEVNSVNAAFTAAQTSLATAQRNLDLAKAGSTPQDIASAQASVRAAQADVQSAKAQLAKTLIVAPFTGLVTKVDAKVGKIVSPNTPEISMISAGTFQIESFVPEINISKLQVGDKAAVTLDAYGEEVEFGASVISIDPAQTIRDGVSTYRAVLEFAERDERIRSGMTANVTITTEFKQGVLAVPQGIVISRDGKKYVRVKQGEESIEREVAVGGVSSRGDIEILSGLSEGEVVVLALP